MQCKRIFYSLIITILCLICVLPTSLLADTNHQNSNVYEEEIYRDDSEIEEAYAARTQYTRELMMKDLHALREQYVDTLPDSSLRSRIVNYALSWVGVTPYVHAGRSLWYGTDCSGFTNLIYAEFGISLPTGSGAYQNSVGYHVSYEDLLPGDIIVYGYGGHVAIYAGDGMVVHCSSPEVGTVVYQMFYREPTAYIRVID